MGYFLTVPGWVSCGSIPRGTKEAQNGNHKF